MKSRKKKKLLYLWSFFFFRSSACSEGEKDEKASDRERTKHLEHSEEVPVPFGTSQRDFLAQVWTEVILFTSAATFRFFSSL